LYGAYLENVCAADTGIIIIIVVVVVVDDGNNNNDNNRLTASNREKFDVTSCRGGYLN
jgi:hypothetical protein